MAGWKEHLLRIALQLELLAVMNMCWFVAGVDHGWTPGKEMFARISSEDRTTDRYLLTWERKICLT